MSTAVGSEDAQGIASRVLSILAKELADASVESASPAPSVRRLTHDELLDGLRLEHRRRGVLPSSIDARLRVLKRFASFLGSTSLLEATRADIEQWLDSCGSEERPLDPQTRRGYVSHLAAFYKWAIDEELTVEDPTRRIPRPVQRRRLPRPIPDAELARVVAAARSQAMRSPAKSRTARRRRLAYLLLAAFAGLRAAEIAGLRVEDVDVEHGLIRVRGKGDKDRQVPLNPEVREALELLPMPPFGPVFKGGRAGVSGPPPKPHNVSHNVNQFLQAHGSEATCHALRHWFATSIYRSTTDLRLVQELLGHSSPATTQVYAAFDPSRAGPAVAALTIRGE